MADEQVLKIVMGYRPIDDNFMIHIFKNNNPLVEYVLRIILGKDDLVVESSETQFELGVLGYRNLKLDVYAKDKDGKVYDIEIQRDSSGAIPKRARYHSSAIDATYLNKGDDFDALPESYVIFFTEKDIMKENEPLYTIDRIIGQTGKAFNDGTHIIYVNGQYKDVHTALGKLIHDFICTEAKDMLCEPMAEITKYYKETPEGVNSMCKSVEDYAKSYAEKYAKEYAEEYAKKERQNERFEMIKKLIKKGFLSNEEIANSLDMPLEEVQRIAAQTA